MGSHQKTAASEGETTARSEAKTLGRDSKMCYLCFLFTRKWPENQQDSLSVQKFTYTFATAKDRARRAEVQAKQLF
jgi:hypothetical protein